MIVFRLDSLGDVVLTTPLFRALKGAHPKSRCTAVVQSAYKPLLVTNRYIDEILTPPEIRQQWLPNRARKLVAACLIYWTQLRQRRFDYAFSPRWDTDVHLATLLCVLTNAATRIGYASKCSPEKLRINRGFDAAYNTCLPPGPVQHELERNLAVGAAVGASAGPGTPEIYLTDGDRRAATKLLAHASPGETLIAVGIGGASPGRRWPLHRYADVLNRLGSEQKTRCVVLCSSSELGDALALDGLLRKRSIVISGAPLREVCAVLEQCELFLGNDSGCAHLAAAMACKTLVISRHPLHGDPNHFNSPVRFAPRGGSVKVVQPEAGRDDCRNACIVPGPHCILAVNTDTVLIAAQELLAADQAAITHPVKPWMIAASQRLLQTHTPAAVQHALEHLRQDASTPLLQ